MEKNILRLTCWASVKRSHIENVSVPSAMKNVRSPFNTISQIKIGNGYEACRCNCWVCVYVYLCLRIHLFSTVEMNVSDYRFFPFLNSLNNSKFSPFRKRSNMVSREKKLICVMNFLLVDWCFGVRVDPPVMFGASSCRLFFNICRSFHMNRHKLKIPEASFASPIFYLEETHWTMSTFLHPLSAQFLLLPNSSDENVSLEE